MKYFFIFLGSLFFYSFYSCSSKQSSQDKERVDSLRKDSIVKSQITRDSLALVAWGDTKFGMSQQEVASSEAFNIKNNNLIIKESGYSYCIMPQEQITNLMKIFRFNRAPKQILANFKDNELYLISIDYSGDDAYGIEELYEDCITFTKEFQKKYGEPKYLRQKMSISDFHDHECVISYFELGSKTIWVGLTENYYKYGYKIHIKNNDFPQKVHELTEEEIKEKEKRAREENEIRNNSF